MYERFESWILGIPLTYLQKSKCSIKALLMIVNWARLFRRHEHSENWARLFRRHEHSENIFNEKNLLSWIYVNRSESVTKGKQLSTLAYRYKFLWIFTIKWKTQFVYRRVWEGVWETNYKWRTFFHFYFVEGRIALHSWL